MTDRTVEGIVETLQRLGLSSYEARTMVALYRLEVASAGEVADVADVPRSQVYGVAERLENRGLIDSQQGTPTRYRPVHLVEAREALLEDLQAAGEAAFDALADRTGDLAGGSERSETIWVIEGGDQVRGRTVQLIDGAEERVLYGVAEPAQLPDAILSALVDRAEAGVETVVLSTNTAVLATLEDVPPVTALRIPGLSVSDLPSGRTLLVDERAVLLSVIDEVAGEETAFYSEDSAFASLLVVIIDGWLRSLMDGLGESEDSERYV